MSEAFYIDPNADQKPLIEGLRGKDGDAKLVSIVGRQFTTKKGDLVRYVDFTVQVKDSEMGTLFIHSGPYTPTHTRIDAKSGSAVNRFFAQLGLTPKFGDPDETGLFPYQGEEFENMAVQVDVGLQTRKDTGATEMFIKDIGRL